jgi:hypothetical protein
MTIITRAKFHAAIGGKIAHGPAVNSDAFKGHAVPGNVARDGAPKRHAPVEFHPGMKPGQVAVAGVGGLAHAIGSAPVDGGNATRLDIGPKNPMKGLAPAPHAAHMRSRVGENGPAGVGVHAAKARANREQRQAHSDTVARAVLIEGCSARRYHKVPR